MKYIIKGTAPAEFVEWMAQENEDWHPSYAILRGKEKSAVKNALMAEQGCICCYCERRLTDEDSHIEHFRPQSDREVDPLDYGNMLCSCQKELQKGEPRHCGNLKDDWFDEQLLISPLDSNCEMHFIFLGNGEILPVSTDDLAAIETIKRLGLNILKLRAMRTAVISVFLDEHLSTDELKLFVHHYLERDEQERFNEFWTTINYLFANNID